MEARDGRRTGHDWPPVSCREQDGRVVPGSGRERTRFSGFPLLRPVSAPAPPRAPGRGYYGDWSRHADWSHPCIRRGRYTVGESLYSVPGPLLYRVPQRDDYEPRVRKGRPSTWVCTLSLRSFPSHTRFRTSALVGSALRDRVRSRGVGLRPRGRRLTGLV